MAVSLMGVELSAHGALHNVIEGQARGPGFHSNVYSTSWREPGAGIFTSSYFFVEMFLGHETVVGASYDPPKSSSAYRQLGDVVFLTGNAPIYCKWRKGRQRSLSCTLDIGTIADRWQIDWEWPVFDPALSLSAGCQHVRATLRRIADEILAPGFASAANVEAALVSVAIELRRGVEAVKPSDERDGDILPARQLAVLQSMLLELNGPGPTVPELAEACGMSGRRLASSYKRSTGVTLRHYMSETRLARAKRLLESSGAPIKQIAYDSGFGSSSAFVAAFRKTIGITPAAYRDVAGCRRFV